MILMFLMNHCQFIWGIAIAHVWTKPHGKSEGEPQPLLRVAVGGADLVSVVPEHAVAAAGNGQEPQEWPRKYLGKSWKRKIFDTRQTFKFTCLFIYLFILMVKLNIGAIPQVLEITPGVRCTKACANKELRPTCEESGGAILDLVVSENGVILIWFIQKLVGGFKHFLFSIIYGIILPID